MAYGWYAFRPYVSAAQKKARAARALARLMKQANGKTAGAKKARPPGRARRERGGIIKCGVSG